MVGYTGCDGDNIAMGGQYEDKIKSAAAPGPVAEAPRPETAEQEVQPAAGAEPTGQTIRFHVSGGDVHFHDDESGLKVAVPISDWYRAWELLRNPRDVSMPGQYTAYYTYSNPDRNTMLICTSAVYPEGGIADISVHVIRCEFDPTWTALEKFRNRGSR